VGRTTSWPSLPLADRHDQDDQEEGVEPSAPVDPCSAEQVRRYRAGVALRLAVLSRWL
jgi:hypothetical protein